MIDILAEVTGIAIGGSGIGVGAILLFFTKREINKLDKSNTEQAEHIANTKVHLDPRNGYIRQSLCDERYNHLTDGMGDIKTDVRNLYKLHQKNSDEQKQLLQQILKK